MPISLAFLAVGIIIVTGFFGVYFSDRESRRET
jgi:hypothetical protein